MGMWQAGRPALDEIGARVEVAGCLLGREFVVETAFLHARRFSLDANRWRFGFGDADRHSVHGEPPDLPGPGRAVEAGEFVGGQPGQCAVDVLGGGEGGADRGETAPRPLSDAADAIGNLRFGSRQLDPQRRCHLLGGADGALFHSGIGCLVVYFWLPTAPGRNGKDTGARRHPEAAPGWADIPAEPGARPGHLRHGEIDFLIHFAHPFVDGDVRSVVSAIDANFGDVSENVHWADVNVFLGGFDF